MLRFRQFLLENRVEFLKQQHKDLTFHKDDHFAGDVMHDHMVDNQQAYSNPHPMNELLPSMEEVEDGAELPDFEHHHIIDYLAHHDPSPKKIHTQWMVHQYKKGNFKLEDAPRVGESLTHFMNPAIKGKLAEKDINKHTPASLADEVDKHSGALSKRQESKMVKQEGADLIHSENGVTVHHLKTKEASCAYGAGTKWCTAAKNNNMFDSYNKLGRIYAVQTPDNRKYQFHFETKSFMDEQDKPIKIEHLVQKHPELKNVKEFKYAGSNHPAANLDNQYNQSRPMDAVRHFLHPHEHDEAITQLAHSSRDYDRHHAAEYGGHIPGVHDKLVNDKVSYIRSMVALKTKNPAHHDILMKDSSSLVRSQVAYSGQDHHRDFLMHDSEPSVRSVVAKSTDNPAHLMHFAKDTDPEVQRSVIFRTMTRRSSGGHISKNAAPIMQELTKNIVSRPAKEINPDVVHSLVSHPEAEGPHGSKILQPIADHLLRHFDNGPTHHKIAAALSVSPNGSIDHETRSKVSNIISNNVAAKQWLRKKQYG